jgi:NAD(P)-dependent dehydrogenase (short-subunit alcohol dehydrogenase family)
MAAYSASKAALEGLTRSMSVELAKYGVRVNCVNPGLVATANQVSKMPDDELKQFPKFIPQVRTIIAFCYFLWRAHQYFDFISYPHFVSSASTCQTRRDCKFRSLCLL